MVQQEEIDDLHPQHQDEIKEERSEIQEPPIQRAPTDKGQDEDKEKMREKSERVFFSENYETATERMESLYGYKGKKVELAKKQIPHTSGWKTWAIK